MLLYNALEAATWVCHVRSVPPRVLNHTREARSPLAKCVSDRGPASTLAPWALALPPASLTAESRAAEALTNALLPGRPVRVVNGEPVKLTSWPFLATFAFKPL